MYNFVAPDLPLSCGPGAFPHVGHISHTSYGSHIGSELPPLTFMTRIPGLPLAKATKPATATCQRAGPTILPPALPSLPPSGLLCACRRWRSCSGPLSGGQTPSWTSGGCAWVSWTQAQSTGGRARVGDDWSGG